MEQRVDQMSQSGADLLGDRDCISESISSQTVAYRKSGCRCPVLAVRLIENVGEVMDHSFLTDEQFLCNLAITLASRNQFEYSGLALGKFGRKRRFLL